MEKFGGGGQRRRAMGDVKMADEEQKIAFLCIRHFHISYNAPYFPPKFCISNVFNFSWDGYNTQEKMRYK